MTLRFDNGHKDQWRRQVGYEVLDTAPAVMVVLNDGPALYPLEPLASLATYASNGEPWIIQHQRGTKFVKVWAEPKELQRIVRESVAALDVINHATGILAIRPKDMELGVPAMGIVTAKSPESLNDSRGIEDNTFFGVTLLEIRREDSSPQYKKGADKSLPEWRILEKWVTEDGLDNWVFDATSTSLGESKATVSYLRQKINALHGRKPGTPIAWFDDDDFYYGLDAEFDDSKTPAEQADGQLKPGIRLQVMGLAVAKPDGNTKFKIKAYKQADPITATAVAPSVVAPATPVVASEAPLAAAAAPAIAVPSSDDVDF